MSLGSRIKERREQLCLSRSELASKIGITPSAIANYENEISSPKIELMYKLFDALDCDANYLHQDDMGSNNPMKVSYKEMEHIKKYRLISEKDTDGKELVDSMVNYLNSKIQSEHKKQLSSQVEKSSNNKLYLYTYLRKIACAGTGFYFDDIPTDMIEAPYLHGTDFVIGVNGNSMEPDYHDGEHLYIQKVHELTLGDTGIFTIGNECFVKELGDNGLISRNPEYDEIPGSEEVRLIGRVLGKIEED